MTALYTQTQAITFIEKVFGQGKLSNAGQNVSVLCPKCLRDKGRGYSKKKLVIRTDNFVCHCWVCGMKAKNLTSVLKTYFPSHLNEYFNTYLSANQLLDVEDQDEQDDSHKEIFLPLGFKLLADPRNHLNPAVRKAKRYLAGRGIKTDKELWYWKFGITEEDDDLANRIIIPSFDIDGKVNYWTARAINKYNKPKYINPHVKRESIVFNEINVDWSKPVTITEGPFDLLKCNLNATCLLGSALSEEYKLFERIVSNMTPVVLALDEDAKTKALDLAKKLSQYSIDVKFLEVPADKGDVGSMSQEEFNSLYSCAIPLTVDNFLSLKIKLLFQ